MDRLETTGRFADLIDECLDLIAASSTGVESRVPVRAESLPSLLEQCRALAQGPAVEPIRTVHHFACTGGTLVLKFLAAMPNTLTISEVEPHSRLNPLESRRFSPSDWITLGRASNRPLSEGLVDELFFAGLQALLDDCTNRGLRLILRDHAHSHYCMGEEVGPERGLRALVTSRYPTRSVVTVRHPLDSFLSLERNHWLHFEPPSLEEYSRRYHRFLDDHDSLPRFHYEEFVTDSDAQVARLCDELALPFNPAFQLTFGQFRFSGDSGRTSPVLGTRERRPVPEEIQSALVGAERFLALCERLGYDLDPSQHR
jgi:hypothetical protein